MEIFNWIDRRMALPGDSETVTTQKRLAVIVASLASVFTALHGIRVYNAGMADIGVTYLVLALLTLAGAAVLLLFPRSYTAVAVILLLLNLVVTLAAHYYGGGFSSGIWFLVWILITPAIAVLFVGRRELLFLTAAFLAVTAAAALLEPQAREITPDVSAAFATTESSTNVALVGLMITTAGLYLFSQIERLRRRADDLLLTILPRSIAERLKESPQTIADGYNDVTVLFADIVGFTTMSSGADPAAVVGKLNEIFTDFDNLAAAHGLEKIKTIGDAYMVAGGLPEPRADHCQAVAAFAVAMQAAMARHRSWDGERMGIRVGIHCGPVVAGVIGRQKFIYDLWGDTVNVASRMESGGLPDAIQVTAVVRERLDGQYAFEERGPIMVKGKGEMVTYLLR